MRQKQIKKPVEIITVILLFFECVLKTKLIL